MMRSLAAVFALLSVSLACAQHFPLEFINGPEGPITTNEFLESEGLILGSPSGLFRFDGRSVARSGRQHGFNNGVNTVVNWGNRMWLGSGSGLFVQNGAAFERLSAHYHGSGVVTKNGIIFTWFDTRSRESDAPLEWFDTRMARSTHPVARLLPFSGHGVLNVDSKGALWFPCGTEVCRVEETGWDRPENLHVQRFGADHRLPADFWTEALKDRRGRIWACSRTRVFVASSEAAVFQKAFSDEGSEKILFEDSDGAVWASGLAGLLRDRGGQRQFFPSRMFGSKPFVAFNALYRDSANNRWLSTVGGGTARWIGNGEITSWGP